MPSCFASRNSSGSRSRGWTARTGARRPWRSARYRPAPLLLMAALLVPGIARAALIDCPPIATTEGAKVVVGEVRPIAQAAAGSSLSPFEERRLVNAIHQQIGQLNAE